MRAAPLACACALLLLAACVAGARRGALPTPAASTTTATATATATPTPSGPLSADEVGALLRHAICWYDQPERAADCLPPQAEALAAIDAMGRSRDARFVAPLIDMRSLPLGWEPGIDEALAAITGQRLDGALRWYAWEATQQPRLPDGYATWKGRLLTLVDPAFAQVLDVRVRYALRPELLIWTGTRTGEVPPLVDPPQVATAEQRYLQAGDVVYALVLRNEARAYPQRIVAWHGMVLDEIGGTQLLLAFCRPCGGAVAYSPLAKEIRYRFADAGLAYDGRTLLVDEQTHSLWDAFTGTPVAGALVGSGVALATLPLVTTTWGDWSAAHPGGLVLALDTGFVRDYAPGTGLRGEPDAPGPIYPPASAADTRLPDKQPVIGLLLGGAARAYPLAAVQRAGIVRDSVGGVAVTLLADGPGQAVRVYRTGKLALTALSGVAANRVATGSDGGDGQRWFVQEGALVSTTDGRRYEAVPYRQAYWFAWSAAYPQSALWAP